MLSSSRLLGRLLLVAGSGATVACGARSEPLETSDPIVDVSGSTGGSAGQAGSGQSGQSQGGAGNSPGGSAGTGPGGNNQGGQAGAAGNASVTKCYQIPLQGDPAPPMVECAPITDLTLPKRLEGFLDGGNCFYVTQVLSGPVEQIGDASASCCYQVTGGTMFCGTGRPLWVGSEARQAGLVGRSGGWS